MKLIFDLQLFANTNTESLNPEFWFGAFDMINKGAYQLQNQVSRGFGSQIQNQGDTVNVPIAPTLTATDWAPGATITPSAVTQETVSVVLDKSKRTTFNITGKEQSLGAYDLIQQWGVPAVETILAAVNADIYKEMIASPYVTDATSGLTELKVIAARTALSNRKVQMPGRVISSSPDDIGTLMGLPAFAQANITGRTDIVIDGMITNRYGFSFTENHAIEKYTPADLAGAVNNGPGYVSGNTAMVVTGFNDDTNPIRKGDVFTVAGSSLQHTVQSVTASSGDTIGLTFLPALDGTVANSAAITVVATRSMLAFIPAATALAARPYAVLPTGVGVQSRVFDYEGFPIRISVYHDGNLGVNVQFDALYGVKNIDTRRIQRILTV